MNKKGDEHWSTISAAVLIIIALIMVFFVNTDSFAEVKKGFSKIADIEAIKKAYDKTIGKEDALTEEEKKTISEFNLFFKNNFAVGSDNDCLREINFDEIKGKGFGLGVRGKNFYVQRDEKARAYRLAVPTQLVALYFDGGSTKSDEDFFIDENFENVEDEFEMMKVVYVNDDKINFLDEATYAELSGEFSSVTGKNICGDVANERLGLADVNFEVVPGTSLEEAQDIIDYLNDSFSYLGNDYKIYEMISYLFELDWLRQRSDVSFLPVPVEEKFDDLINEIGDHLEEYFGEEYRGLPIPSENKCWLASVDRGDLNEIITFGKSPGQNLRYRDARISLSDGSEINFRLLVSKEGCLPARKIDMLLDNRVVIVGEEQ